MRQSKYIIILGFVLVILLVIAAWYLNPHGGGEAESGGVEVPGPSATRSEPSPERDIVPAVGVEELALELHSDSIDPAEDIAILHSVLSSYRRAAGTNPEGGENGAIADRLLGKNAMGVRFLPDRPEWLSEKGELLDRWGTPYFFHPLSGEEMEIVSAGPDRKLWTEDDVTQQ